MKRHDINDADVQDLINNYSNALTGVSNHNVADWFISGWDSRARAYTISEDDFDEIFANPSAVQQVAVRFGLETSIPTGSEEIRFKLLLQIQNTEGVWSSDIFELDDLVWFGITNLPIDNATAGRWLQAFRQIIAPFPPTPREDLNLPSDHFLVSPPPLTNQPLRAYTFEKQDFIIPGGEEGVLHVAFVIHEPPLPAQSELFIANKFGLIVFSADGTDILGSARDISKPCPPTCGFN